MEKIFGRFSKGLSASGSVSLASRTGLFSVKILLAALAAVLVWSGAALADVVTIRPDSVSATGSWTGVTAANLNDSGDATFASITGTLSTFTVGLNNDAAYSGGTINSVIIWVRAQATGSGAGEKFDFGPTGALSGTAKTATRGAFADASHAPAGPFTDADVDTLQIDVASTALGAGETLQAADVWVVVDYTPAAGGPNQLATCADCHTYPPSDGASRNASPGAVVGSHAAHNAYTCDTCHVIPATQTSADFAHRNDDIQMAANIQGGTYSKGTAFSQANDLNGTGLGNCLNVACHNGSPTPTWGGTATCDTCHSLPPATNAHTTHYTAKGWATGVETNCTQCHPDNTAGHTSVTDGTVVVNAGLSPSGASPAISCGGAPALGCHNGKSTPAWNTAGITCTQCHTAGGADVADPVTGLHDETPVVSGVIHNPSDPNFASCEDCHTATPSSAHWDGAFQNSSPTIAFAAMVNFADATPPTCTATCHSENGASGPWARKWHENSDLSDGSQCAGCHGDWLRGWNGGVTHRTDADPQSTHGTGAAYECKDCHALESGTGNYLFTSGTQDWGTEGSTHGNGTLNINDDGAITQFDRGTGGDAGKSGCAKCHNAFDGTDGALNQHSFTTTGWSLLEIVGDTVNAGCDSCHGGGGQYWPNGSAYPDRAGRHDAHMQKIAGKLGIALPGTDLEQRRMCEYCHNDSNGVGGGGHSDYVQPADVGGFNPVWDVANPPSVTDTGSAFTSADGSCASIDCHNNKATGAGTYGWRDAGGGTCTMCHTAGGFAGEIGNPTSGLHSGTAPTVSGQKHDDTLTACSTCHGSLPATATSTHVDGAFTGDTVANLGLLAAYTQSAADVGTCSGGSVGGAGCHDGAGDAGTWARKWDLGINNATGGNECKGCHGGFASDWTYSGAVAGNVDHERDWDGNNGAEIMANHDGTDKCKSCHVYPDAPYGSTWGSGNHGNGQIDMNSTMGYSSTNWNCTSSCHSDNTNHNLEDSGWAVSSIAGPALSCTGCHGGGSPAAGVSSTSFHVIRGNKAGYNTFNACVDCHPGGTRGAQHAKSGDANVVAIPNNPTVGINYSHIVTGSTQGFVLGGDATTGTTEAEICWNCHNNATYQATVLSEWGLNTDTNGAAANYDFGSLSQPNWVGATWTSANFSYKTGSILSTHSVNDSVAAAGVDAVADIRCSYCHNVHNGTLGDGATKGKPFLRGTWKGSPYKEDGAPRGTLTFTENGNFGQVPRGGTQANTYGGYQIDQNNGNPTSTWTAGNSAGLCELCHGSGDGAWTATEINALNKFGTAANAWVGANGHANAALGGGGTASGIAANLFRFSDRNPIDGVLAYVNSYEGGAGAPSMAYQNALGERGGGFRSQQQGWNLTPQTTASQPYAYNGYNWGATVNEGTTDDRYHKFSCSKCHNPHASRLPRLMISNCLDTKMNTWDETKSAIPAAGTWNDAGKSQVSADNGGRTFSNATSAQNCHRLKDPAQPNGGSGSGWNLVTPWDNATTKNQTAIQ